jgi:hypothetical protein
MWFIFFWGYYVTNIKIFTFKIVFLNHLLTDYFLAEGIWKVHIFCHLFVCFQTSVYTLGEFHKNRNNIVTFSVLEYRDLFSLLTQDFNYLLIVIKMSWKCMPLTKNCKNNKCVWFFFYTEMKLVYLMLSNITGRSPATVTAAISDMGI